MRLSPWALAPALMVCLPFVIAQEREDRALYSWQQMRQIIDEASGERAMQHVMELAPFPHSRPKEEYEKRFRESDVIVKFAREYGFSDVEVESYPVGAPSWQATQGELWLLGPESRKLYDVHDVIISCIAGSDSGDVTAELIDVGAGDREEDYAAKDVKGKIVIGSAPIRSLQQLATLARGAAGVITYDSHRSDAYPSEILDQEKISVGLPAGKKGGFAWGISPLVAHELINRLQSGEKVSLRSVIQGETFPGRLEMVHAAIPGDGSTDQAIMVSAHIYEQYTKQGANDNASGTGMTLEMGRTILRLIADGKIPRPKRTIHFTWGAEVTGTMAWLAKHDDIRKKLIADLNFDQVGLGLRMGGSTYYLYRTPDTTPSYVNDVCASFLEFVAKTNRERIRYRYSSSAYGFAMPVTAPTGSSDPFYAGIEKNVNASDHRIFLDKGIAAAHFSDWPSMWYHSSHDTPYQGILDATQLKRAAVIGVAAASLIATADDSRAVEVLAESLARGTERLGDSQRKGLGYMADSDASTLGNAYKEARNTIRHQEQVEKTVLESVAALFSDPAVAKQTIAPFEPMLATRAKALQDEAAAYFRARAAQYKTPTTEPGITEEEKAAASSTIEVVPGPGRVAIPPARREAVNKALTKLPSHMLSEFTVLASKKKTILEIRNFLSGEFEPLSLADLTEYIMARAESGNLKIVKR